MMRCSTSMIFIAAVLQSVVHAQGSIAAGQQGQLPAPVPLPNSPLSAKECGAPWARCGLSIPKGVNCPQGPGWCQKGYYCGMDYKRADKSDESLRCLPVPPDCGKAGKPCCPSNTDTPNTKREDIFRGPFCRDGSTCFSPNNLGMVPDFYIGWTGTYSCTPVAADCGSAPGKPCCPDLWRTAANPPYNSDKRGCWAPGLKCLQDNIAKPATADPDAPYWVGTCVAGDSSTSSPRRMMRATELPRKQPRHLLLFEPPCQRAGQQLS